MLQLGRRFDLALKTRGRSRILHHALRQHLDRHDAMHPPMLGLEHLPHAAGADFVEDRVVAEDQRLGSARVDFLGLKFRQMLALDQLPGKFLGVFGLGLRRNKIFQLARRDDARIGKLLDELFEGDGHDFLQGPESESVASLLVELPGVVFLPELIGRKPIIATA